MCKVIERKVGVAENGYLELIRLYIFRSPYPGTHDMTLRLYGLHNLEVECPTCVERDLVYLQILDDTGCM